MMSPVIRYIGEPQFRSYISISVKLVATAIQVRRFPLHSREFLVCTYAGSHIFARDFGVEYLITWRQRRLGQHEEQRRKAGLL